jgi:hypothetical protein
MLPFPKMEFQLRRRGVQVRIGMNWMEGMKVIEPLKGTSNGPCGDLHPATYLALNNLKS